MTVIGHETRLDEVERDNLERLIASMETVGASNQSFFAPVLYGLRAQLTAVEKKIADGAKDRFAKASEQVVLIQMARQEALLSAQEKETFSGFLEKQHFAKADFASLESFYARTWDRLSNDGKDAVSERVWEGVRRNEYTVAELPEAVRKKESEWLYLKMTDLKRHDPKLESIPAQDRADFIREFETGNRKAAEEVLARKGFAENLGSRQAASKDAATKGMDCGERETFEETTKQTTSAREVDGGFKSTLGDDPAPVRPTELRAAAKMPVVTR